ncbi:MAG: tetratricopeptide repeat protein [Paracoccaceae bacterium]
MTRKRAARRYEAGIAAERAGRLEAAAKDYAAALKADPGFAEAANNLGRCWLRMGRLEQAGKALRRAAKLRPGEPVILGNLALWARESGDVEATAEHLEALAEVAPAAGTIRMLVGTLRALGRNEAALAWAKRLAASGGGTLGDLTERIHLARTVCDWEALEGLDDAALRARLAADRGYAGSPFRLYAHVADPALLREVAERAAAEAARGVSASPPARPETAAGAPIRVGVISQDLRDHPMLKLIAGVLGALDPARIALHVYAPGPPSDDPRRAALARRAAAFRAFPTEGDDEIAAAVRADRLHVLIDLMGYTRNARPGVPARRPAPVQAAWLGLPGTSGAAFVDVILADAVTILPGAEQGFSERVVRLSPTYYPFDPAVPRPRRGEADRTSLGLPETGVAFAGFNQSFKLDPERFATWMAVLRAVPGSVLWLMAAGEAAEARLRRSADAEGVAGDRLVFAPRVPHEAHMARLAAADLALDTRLYGGHTTTIDALWCGVPAITRAGPTFPSRVAASILEAAGLGRLVVPSEAEYLELAVGLARDPARLAALQAETAALPAEAPPFDAAGFAEGLTESLEALARGT